MSRSKRPCTPAEPTPEDSRLALRQSRGLLDEHLARLRATPVHGNRSLRIDQLFHGLLLARWPDPSASLRGAAISVAD